MTAGSLGNLSNELTMKLSTARSLFAVAAIATMAAFGAILGKKAPLFPARRLADGFPRKKQFVNLNGGVCRALGRRLCNGVYRSPDGMLLVECKVSGSASNATNTIAFAKWLDVRGIPYLYIQAPAKIDMAGSMLPSCFIHRGDEASDVFLSMLGEASVNTLDLRKRFTATPQSVKQYFYRTDHHWNNDAAFEALCAIAPRVAALAGCDPEVVEPFLRRERWERKVVHRCFIGSQTRRTGTLFGGLDDVIVYSPRFRTKMTLQVPSKDILLSGDFRSTVMYRAGEVRPNKARADAYSLVYTGVGGSYRMARHVNPDAPIRRKLLLVGDSFARPVEGLLSILFTDVMALDQRCFVAGETVVGHVKSFKPDCVVQLNNPFAFGNARKRTNGMFEYGELR